MSATCRKWREVCCSDLQPLWREFVSKKFGRKYENYVTFTGDNDWRSLYLKISTFISNLRRGNAKVKYHPTLLEPPLSDSYEGCLAMATDCSCLLWENGKVLQCVDIEEGKELWRASVTNRKGGASRPSVVVGKTKVFLHLEQQVHVFELSNGAFVSLLSIPPDTDASASAGCAETPGNNMPLDVSLRNLHFTFLTKRTLFVFHSENLKLLYKVQHRELTPLIDTVEGIDFCWAGNRCCAGPDGTECHECSANGLMLRPQCQQICRHIVTWLVKRSRSIKIWDIRDGANVYCLRGHEAPVQKVRHVMNWRDLAEYFLASLDTEGSVRIWGSHNKHFVCLQELKPDISRGTVFRMSFSSTHLMTMSKETAGGDVLITIWKFDQTTANTLLRRAPRSHSKNAERRASTESRTNSTNQDALVLPSGNPQLSRYTVKNSQEGEPSSAATQHPVPSFPSSLPVVRSGPRLTETGKPRSSCDSPIRCCHTSSVEAESEGLRSSEIREKGERVPRNDGQRHQTLLEAEAACRSSSWKEDGSVAADCATHLPSVLSIGEGDDKETRKSLGPALTSLRHPLRGCSSAQLAVDPDDPSPYVKRSYLHTRSRELSDLPSTWDKHLTPIFHVSRPASPSPLHVGVPAEENVSSSDSLLPLTSALDISPPEDDLDCDCPFCNCGSSNRCLFRRRRRHGRASSPQRERSDARIRIVPLTCSPAWPSLLSFSQVSDTLASPGPDVAFGFSLPPALPDRRRREDAHLSALSSLTAHTSRQSSCSSRAVSLAPSFPDVPAGTNQGHETGGLCSVLQKEASFSAGIRAYYADFIDGQLLALWHFNVPSGRRYTAFQYSLSDWKVYDCIGKDATCPFHVEEQDRRVFHFGEDVATRTGPASAAQSTSEPSHQSYSLRLPGNQLGNSAAGHAVLPAAMGVDGASSAAGGTRQIRRSPGPPAFSMENRGDVWTLLDWKCVSLDPRGNVTVFDFCPKQAALSCQPC